LLCWSKIAKQQICTLFYIGLSIGIKSGVRGWKGGGGGGGGGGQILKGFWNVKKQKKKKKKTPIFIYCGLKVTSTLRKYLEIFLILVIYDFQIFTCHLYPFILMIL
jgi:hypothetical protein